MIPYLGALHILGHGTLRAELHDVFRKLSLASWLIAAVASVSLGDREHSAPTIVTQRDGRIRVRVHVPLDDDTRTRHYTVTVAEPFDAVLRSSQVRWKVEAGERMSAPVDVEVPPTWFERGPRALYVRIDSENGTQRIKRIMVSR